MKNNKIKGSFFWDPHTDITFKAVKILKGWGPRRKTKVYALAAVNVPVRYESYYRVKKYYKCWNAYQTTFVPLDPNKVQILTKITKET